MHRRNMQGAGKARRWLRLGGLTLAVAVLGLAAAIYGVLHGSAFLPFRQGLAAEVIGDILARKVEIRGPVALSLGRRLTVRIEDAYVERSSGGSQARVFEKVSFEAGVGLLFGRLDSIDNYQMSGADIELRPRPADREQVDANSYARLPAQIINSPVLDNFDLQDVKFSFVDETAGWNEHLEIRTLQSVRDPGTKSAQLLLDATFNGTPFKITGHIPSSGVEATDYSGSFDLSLTIPGLEAHTSGTIDTSADIAGIKGQMSAEAGSIKTLLASLGLESGLEGTATLTSRVSGPVDQLDLEDLDARFENEIKDRVTVSGTVNRSLTRPVVDLRFKTVLSPPANPATDRFSINVNAVEGHVSGPFDALTVDDVVIRTDAVLLDFDEIGPISAGRVVKHPDNSVGLEDLVVRDGPADAPYMTLTGRMTDLIAFSGLDLKGSYRFPTALLLKRSPSSAERLGSVAGDVALNDSSGSFGLQALSGAVENTDLLELSYELAIPDFRVIDEMRFSTDITLPAPGDVLTALDLPGKVLPAMGFLGAVTVAPDGARLNGSVTSGASAIDAAVKLAAAPDSTALVLSGAVTSQKADLTDIADLVTFTRQVATTDGEAVDLAEDLKSVLEVDIHVSVKEIVAGRNKAGNLSAEIGYQADKLDLSSLKMTFLGGTVRGDFGVDYTRTPELLSAHGRMEKFPLKSLMAELGLTSPLSSTVYASFDVSGLATSETAFLKSLSGRLTASLWGGTLPNRLLDLAGLSVFTWLVTGNEDGTTKLVCAVLPLRFKGGVASGTSLIVETPNVQVVGAGSINFRSGTLDLAFAPRAKRKQLVEIVSPFELHGTLKDPKLTVRDAGPGRVVGEVLATPLNLIGHLFTGSKAIHPDAKPCSLPKNSKPK